MKEGEDEGEQGYDGESETTSKSKNITRER